MRDVVKNARDDFFVKFMIIVMFIFFDGGGDFSSLFFVSKNSTKTESNDNKSWQ